MNNLLQDLSFCVFDIEATGGNLKTDEMIEIGMVRIEGLQVIASKSFLIKPRIPIPSFVQRLTRLSPEKLQDAPYIEDILPAILEFMGDSILVAHNSSFDVPFFNAVLRKHEKPDLNNNVICTNVMTNYLIPEIANSNLGYLSELFNIDHGRAHRAEDDALATGELLLLYLGYFQERGLSKLNQLYYPRKNFELNTLHTYDSNQLEQLLNIFQAKANPPALLFFFRAEQGALLTVLPVLDLKRDLSWLKDVASKLNWKKTTVKMIGHPLEALFQFHHFYQRDPTAYQTVAEYYATFYDAPSLDYQAILFPHLIDDHFLAYAQNSFRRKLIFRFPAHRKKLERFLQNCRSQKIKKTDTKLACIIAGLIERHKSEIVLVQKKNSEKELIAQLEGALTQDHKTYAYPQHYIQQQ